jgi:hypothetical protein
MGWIGMMDWDEKMVGFGFWNQTTSGARYWACTMIPWSLVTWVCQVLSNWSHTAIGNAIWQIGSNATYKGVTHANTQTSEPMGIRQAPANTYARWPMAVDSGGFCW